MKAEGKSDQIIFSFSSHPLVFSLGQPDPLVFTLGYAGLGSILGYCSGEVNFIRAERRHSFFSFFDCAMWHWVPQPEIELVPPAVEVKGLKPLESQESLCLLLYEFTYSSNLY